MNIKVVAVTDPSPRFNWKVLVEVSGRDLIRLGVDMRANSYGDAPPVGFEYDLSEMIKRVDAVQNAEGRIKRFSEIIASFLPKPEPQPTQE